MDLTKYKNCRAHKQWLFISNDEKTMRPCCYFKTDIQAENLQDYREQLSKLDIKTNCENCISLEESGNKYTQRQELEDGLTDRQLKITVAFDNLCNLKCIYCSPRYSTQIATENIKFATYKDEKETKLYKIISEQTPQKIKFLKDVLLNEDYDDVQFEILGGEPLINPLIFDFLDWMTEQPFAHKIRLTMLTNGTVFTDKIFKYSTVFQYAYLGVSIDGVDDVFEYIRSNGKYKEVKNNLDQYYLATKEYNNFRLTFNYALTWMNCLYFPEWYNWICTDYPDTPGIHMNKLIYPEYFSVDVIPITGKKYILEQVDQKILKTTTNKILSDAYEKYKTQMITGEDKSYLYPLAIENLKRVDDRREYDYKTTFSEILNIMRKCHL